MTKKSLAIDATPSGKTRYELKMICQETSYPEIKMALFLNPTAIHTLYPPRRVQSVYLDTPNNLALHENLAGVSHREKIRFRWYGDAIHGVSGNLECKVKENMQGWKHILKINQRMNVEGMARHRFVQILRGQATPEWWIRLAKASEPVQWISYLREYFASNDGRIRITMDRELRSWDQRGKFTLSSAFRTPLPRLLIVEVKCTTEHYDVAERLVNQLPLFVDKCSKFVMASSPGQGPIVSILGW